RGGGDRLDAGEGRGLLDVRGGPVDLDVAHLLHAALLASDHDEAAVPGPRQGGDLLQLRGRGAQFQHGHRRAVRRAAVRPAPSGLLRSIRPISRERRSPFSTTSAIRTPSAATRTDWIRPSSPGVRTSIGSPAPSSRSSSRGAAGLRSATHRPPRASQLGAVSRSASVLPVLRSTGAPREPPDTSDPTSSDLPSTPTPAAVCSSQATATERSCFSPSPRAPGTGSGSVSSEPAAIRTARWSPSRKY